MTSRSSCAVCLGAVQLHAQSIFQGQKHVHDFSHCAHPDSVKATASIHGSNGSFRYQRPSYCFCCILGGSLDTPCQHCRISSAAPLFPVSCFPAARRLRRQVCVEVCGHLYKHRRGTNAWYTTKNGPGSCCWINMGKRVTEPLLDVMSCTLKQCSNFGDHLASISSWCRRLFVNSVRMPASTTIHLTPGIPLCRVPVAL